MSVLEPAPGMEWRDEAIAVMAWQIAKGMGDCRIWAQETGRVGSACVDPADPSWRAYRKWAEEGIDGLLAAGFTIQPPSVFGVEQVGVDG